MLKTVQKLTLAGLVIAGAYALATFGYRTYEPYFAATRPWAHALVFALSVGVLVLLWWPGRMARRGLGGWLLLAAWCTPPLALGAADWCFARAQATVATADSAELRGLGRHFIVGYRHEADVAPLAAHGLIAGIYITHHNIAGRTVADLKAEIARLQALRRDARLPPLIVAADQEGGIVSHLSPQLTAMPGLSSLAALAPERRAALAQAIGEVQGEELRDLGVTLNFAPVVDLRREAPHRHVDLNSLIDRRAISDDPAIVSDIALNYIHGLAANGVGATIKHFPGLGRADADTHLFGARIEAPRDELDRTDFRPFRDLASSSGAALMVGHATVTALDPDHPASVSRRVIDDTIRGAWGFRGLIVTDDMVMGAIYRHGICHGAVASLNAGADLVLIAYDGAQFVRAYPCLRAAMLHGEIDPVQLRESAARLFAAGSETAAR